MAYPELKYPSFGTRDFSGGINQAADSSLIKENECDDVQNCICKTLGILESREGQEKLNSAPLSGPINGLYGYYHGEDLSLKKLIVASGGNIYFEDDDSFTEINTGLDQTAPMLFETCVNFMVGGNGVDAPWKYDGTNPVSPLANAPAKGKCPVLHKEKLFWIADNDTIVWSDSFYPEQYPGVNVWNFDAGNGDKLSMIARFGRDLIVCKERRIHILQGSSLDDFRSDVADPDNGVAGVRAGIVKDGAFYGISYDGIIRFNGLRSDKLSEAKLRKVWGNVDKEYLHTAVAGYNSKHNQLWFNVPEKGSETPNMVIVLDLNYGGWWIFRGITASCMIEFNNGAEMELYTGDTTTGTVVKQNSGYADFGEPIDCYYIPPNHTDGSLTSIKAYKKMFVGDVPGMDKAQVSYRMDNGVWIYPQQKTELKGVRQFVIPNAKGREFQPRLKAQINGNNFGVSSIETMFVPGNKR